MKNSNKTNFLKIILVCAFAFIITFTIDYTNSNDENSSKVDNANINLQYKTTDSELKLVPLGGVFGVKIYTNGVIVTSLQSINTNGVNICPAKDSGIQVGDFILKVEGIEVENNNHFTQLLSTHVKDEINLTIKRNSEIFDINIHPVLDGNAYKLGMWIRDSAAGIGTLTYYNPETKTFAGLGHGICDVDTGELMSLKNGEPASVEISNVDKGVRGTPGKICGFFSEEGTMGTIVENTETGIYGTLSKVPEGQALPVAKSSEIKVGDAQIMSTLENGKTETYNVYIKQINGKKTETKNMIVQITDEYLLDKTGGIVQGMSGSPIIQNGKIIGAVTHVFVNDPTMGYGIFIENMLNTAENIE